jgi:glycosyltransferase involved in cell wall biosynthesis
MQRIKVLHITQSVGGVETYLKQVISTIDHSKYELKIVGTISENLEPYCIKYNVPFIRLKMARGLNPVLDLASVFQLKKILQQESPACAHLHSAKGGFLGRIACKLAKQKSLYTPHALSYLSFTGVKRELFFALEKFAGYFTYKLLAISHSEAERLVNDLGQKREDIYVIPNSLVVENYFYTAFSNDTNLHTLDGEIKVGTIARLTPQKNPLLFIDIANEVIKKEGSRVHFYFLGVGEHDHLKKEVEERIQRYGIGNNIHLLQRGDLQTSIHFLQQLDVFLFPSVFEGLSYALLEAMLQGVPCVVSNVDGNNDVIHNNINGFTCDTLQDYTNAIASLINDKQKSTALGQAAKDYVLKYHDLHKNIHQLEKIYSEFVDMHFN